MLCHKLPLTKSIMAR